MKQKNRIITKKMISQVIKSNYGMLEKEEKYNCKDDIIIKLGYKEFKSGENMINNLPCYECVFCERKMNSLNGLENPIVIDATEYKKAFDLNNELEYLEKKQEIKNIILSHMIEKEGATLEYLLEDIKDELKYTKHVTKTK